MALEIGMRVEHWYERYRNRPLEGCVVEDPNYPNRVNIEWYNGDFSHYFLSEAEIVCSECKCGICCQREWQCKCAEWNLR